MLLLKRNSEERRVIDRGADFYPTSAAVFTGRDAVKVLPDCGDAYYGFVRGGTVKFTTDFVRNAMLWPGSYFATSKAASLDFAQDAEVVIFSRRGFRTQEVIGAVEERGRLQYIDGCDDSLLVYPPRLGDPSLNHLHFPEGVVQSQHTHPTVRMGMVIRGNGTAFCDDPGNEWEEPLHPGDVFCLAPGERHSFRTDFLPAGPMDIIAFHPTSSVGPTDESHAMLAQTHLVRK